MAYIQDYEHSGRQAASGSLPQARLISIPT